MIALLQRPTVLLTLTTTITRPAQLRVIDQIRIPTLIIHAQDDPFIPFAPLRDPAITNNPYILLIDTERGGHVAFVSGKSNGEDRFWSENRVMEFCTLVQNTICPKLISRSS